MGTVNLNQLAITGNLTCDTARLTQLLATPTVAIIGDRHHTNYGHQATFALARDLATAGITSSADCTRPKLTATGPKQTGPRNPTLRHDTLLGRDELPTHPRVSRHGDGTLARGRLEQQR